MGKREAKKSQQVLDTMVQNVEAFNSLLPKIEDDLTKQNIIRSIILFSCSGIDAVVKQIIHETLEMVIERDEGAQEQLKKFTERKLRDKSDLNYKFLSDLLIAKNARRLLIGMLVNELTFDSLQSSEQLYKVASYFNIKTQDLLNEDERIILKNAFMTRNVIVHQMDVDFKELDLKVIQHTEDEAQKFFVTIRKVAQNYIDLVNGILDKPVTKDFAPMFSVEGGTLVIQEY